MTSYTSPRSLGVNPFRLKEHQLAEKKNLAKHGPSSLLQVNSIPSQRLEKDAQVSKHLPALKSAPNGVSTVTTTAPVQSQNSKPLNTSSSLLPGNLIPSQRLEKDGQVSKHLPALKSAPNGASTVTTTAPVQSQNSKQLNTSSTSNFLDDANQCIQDVSNAPEIASKKYVFITKQIPSNQQPNIEFEYDSANW